MKIYESDWCSWMNFDKMGLKWNITGKYKPGGRYLSGGLPSAILAEAPSLFYNDDVFLWWLRWWQCWTLGWFTMMIMVVKMLMRQTTAKSNISSSARANQVWDPRSQFRDPSKIQISFRNFGSVNVTSILNLLYGIFFQYLKKYVPTKKGEDTQIF